MNSLDFLQKKNEPPDVRVRKAQELLESQQLSSDTLMKWLSKSFANDDDKFFRLSIEAWNLFKEILQNWNIKADRFTINIKPTDLLPVYQSDLHQKAFETIEILVEKYPDAWRPDYRNLIEFISKMVMSQEIHKYEISLMMKVLLDKPEVTAAIKSIFDYANKFLLKPILQHIDQLDQEISFVLLATLISVPFFVRKASDGTGKNTKELVNALNEYPEASSRFAPYLIRNFVKQMNLLNISMSLNFPLEIIEGSQNLIVAAPLIRECRELNMYKQANESKDLERLKKLALRSIDEKRSDALVELSLIDFKSVQPFLSSILPNKEIATPELSVAILTQCFKLKNPMIIFEIGQFPSHILSYPDFIFQYCEGISHLTAKQLIMVLNHLVSFPNNLEESCLLYWSIKSGRLTQEFDEIIDSLLNDCFSNPWRFTAAAIAAKKLQKQPPPPLDIVKDPTTHPVILDCFLCENYGTIEFQDEKRIEEIIDKDQKVPEIPSPFMSGENSTIYRFAFLIRNLPFVSESISTDKLIEILKFIISSSIFASNLSEPETISDYCLNLIHNSAFYESKEIKNAFPNAVLPLLPSHHLSSLEPHNISINQFYHSAIIAAFPTEFLSQKVATAAFVGLFLAFEGNEKMELGDDAISELKLSSIFDDLYKPETLVNCICNVAENISKTFVKHNLIRVFSNCTNDSAVSLIPILFEHFLPDDENVDNFNFPDIEIKHPSQLISICNFCYEHSIKLPFEETLFADDLDSFCAQIRAGHKSTISKLIEITNFDPKEVQKIIMALNDLQSNENIFNFDFLKLPIDSLVQNEEKLIDGRIVSQFCTKLSIEANLYFLEVATSTFPLFYYPLIFKSLNIKRDDFPQFQKYIEKLLKPEKHSKSIDISILKLMCSIKLSYNYNTVIVSRLLFLISTETIRISLDMNNNAAFNCLSEICLLCQSIVQLVNNCNKELSKQPINTIEIVRKISSLFCRSISKESPSYKQLKQFAKMFAAVAKVAFQDQLHDLIASFVSHLTFYKPDDSEKLKMKSLQTSVFPLFNRCSREQLNEVSASLHDSHREIFKQLSERWTNEAQYKGKV